METLRNLLVIKYMAELADSYAMFIKDGGKEMDDETVFSIMFETANDMADEELSIKATEV